MPRIQSNTKTFEDVLVAVQNKELKIIQLNRELNLNGNRELP